MEFFTSKHHNISFSSDSERLERLFGTYHQSHRTRLPLAFLRGQAAFCCYCLCLKRFCRTCLFYLLIRKLIAWRIWLAYQYSPLNSRMCLFLHSRSHYLSNDYHLLLFRFPHQHPLQVVRHLQGILRSHRLKEKNKCVLICIWRKHYDTNSTLFCNQYLDSY